MQDPKGKREVSLMERENTRKKKKVNDNEVSRGDGRARAHEFGARCKISRKAPEEGDEVEIQACAERTKGEGTPSRRHRVFFMPLPRNEPILLSILRTNLPRGRSPDGQVMAKVASSPGSP